MTYRSLFLALMFVMTCMTDPTWAHKESVSALEFSTYKEAQEKHLADSKELQRRDVDAQDRLLALQSGRIGDVSLYLTAFGVVFALLAIIASWLGYVTVRNRALQEARAAAANWFEKEGRERIQGWLKDFETHVETEKGNVRIKAESAQKELQAAVQEQIDVMQTTLNSKSANTSEPEVPSEKEPDPLMRLIQTLKRKPENDYSFADWNARAFDAFRQNHRALAIEYWLNAANASDSTRIELANTILNAAIVLSDDGKTERALDLYDDVIHRFSAEKDLDLRVCVAKALTNKSVALAKLRRWEQALEVSKELMDKFSSAVEEPLRDQVAWNQFNIGTIYQQSGSLQESIAHFDALIAEFGSEPRPTIRLVLAMGLVNKGIALVTSGKISDAISVYDEVISKFSAASDTSLRVQVGNAYLSKAIALSKDHDEKVLEILDELIVYLGDDKEQALRILGAKALNSKALALGRLNRRSEADTFLDEVIAINDPMFNAQIAVAENTKGFTSLLRAKQQWANQDSREVHLKLAIELFARAVPKSSQDPVVLGNHGYALFLQGNTAAARPILKDALQRGGERLRAAELDDSRIHPVPNDESFRALIEELWLELENEKSLLYQGEKQLLVTSSQPIVTVQ
jgi:tetratricopeptide (TPR) repeat protein